MERPIVLLTESYLIRGRLEKSRRRLTTYLNKVRRTHIDVLEASLVELDSAHRRDVNVLRVGLSSIVLAHEFVPVESHVLLQEVLGADRRRCPVSIHLGSTRPIGIRGEVAARVLEEWSDDENPFVVVSAPRFEHLESFGESIQSVFQAFPYVIVGRARVETLLEEPAAVS